MEPNENDVLLHDDTPDVDRECPLCGERSVTTYLHHDTFTYGSGDTAAELEVVDLPVRRCGECDIEFLDHEGERLRHDAVCRHLGVLTPGEIRDIRDKLHMTRAAFADLTGLGDATLNRWENGAVVQNRANDRYLRLLDFPEVMDRLHDITARGGSPAASEAANSSRFRLVRDSAPLNRRQQDFTLRKAS